MYQQFSIAWSPPWGQLEHGLCMACYYIKPRSGLFPEGSVAKNVVITPLGSLTEGPIPPNTTNFVPNMFNWVHIRTIGGPIHVDDVLFMEVSIHYTNPDGVWHYHQPVANCCDTMSCHVEPSCPPELGDKRLQWHLIQNAQGGFSHERYHPIHVQNRLREPPLPFVQSSFMASPTSLRTRIRLSIRKSMNRLSSQKMTCCHWPSGRLMCFWAQWRRTSLTLTVNLDTFTIRLAL